MSEGIDDQTAFIIACLNDPEWMKANGARLVREAAKHNRLLQLAEAGLLAPLLQEGARKAEMEEIAE